VAKRRSALLISLILVLAGSFLIYDQLSTHQKPEIKLLSKISGSEAVEMVKRIHSGDFYVVNAEIREYSGGIRVWIAYVNDSETARKYVEEMAERVGEYFSQPEKVRVDRLLVYRVYGMGKTHYFFSIENSVVWVEFSRGDFEFHKRALKEIFGI